MMQYVSACTLNLRELTRVILVLVVHVEQTRGRVYIVKLKDGQWTAAVSERGSTARCNILHITISTVHNLPKLQ